MANFFSHCKLINIDQEKSLIEFVCFGKKCDKTGNNKSIKILDWREGDSVNSFIKEGSRRKSYSSLGRNGTGRMSPRNQLSEKEREKRKCFCLQ
jgi:hypothetical protein